MRRMGRLLTGLMVALALSGATGALAADSREPADAVSFEVKGNANEFQVAKWRKKKAIQLADCVVRDISPQRTGRRVPTEYINREMMQKIFDEILAGEVILLGEREEARWREAAGGLDAVSATIACESPKGSNLYAAGSKGTMFQQPGQGYAHMELTHVDALGPGMEDVVRIYASVYTRRISEGGYAFVRSSSLRESLLAMVKRTYDIEELADAGRASWRGEAGAPDAEVVVEDARGIAQLVAVLSSGEPVEEPIQAMPVKVLRFTKQNGLMLTADIAREIQGGSEKSGEPRYFLLTPNEVRRVDLQAVNDALLSAGLPQFTDVAVAQ